MASLCTSSSLAVGTHTQLRRTAFKAVPAPAARSLARAHISWPGQQQRRNVILYATSTPGGSVLDAPVTIGEKSTERVMKKPPSYKVLLHNDNYNRREYVVRVLLKVVKGITKDDAITAMNEAHETGVAMVITCPQEDAEKYCEGLRLNGLTASIEPGC